MYIWKKMEEDREFRLKSWEFALRRMPLTVMMDLIYRNFYAKDHTDSCVYADTLDRQRFDEIVSEWAELLCPGNEAAFQKKFCLQAIERQMEAGKKEIRLFTGQPPKRVLVRAVPVAELRESCVQFFFEPA